MWPRRRKAMKKISSDYIPYVRQEQVVIVLDSKEEAEDLPTDVAPTSVAILPDTGIPMWMMNNSGEWKPVNEAASGS